MLMRNSSLYALIYVGIPLSLHAMEQVPLSAIDLALIHAAQQNNLRKVNKQLQLGAQLNPKSTNTTALIEACKLESNNATLIQVLLANDADPNIPDAQGRTPLHFLAHGNNTNVLDMLKTAGLMLMLKTNRATHLAIMLQMPKN